MADYRKPDTPEPSDDAERQIETLKDDRKINAALTDRLSAIVSALGSRRGEAARAVELAQVVMRVFMEFLPLFPPGEDRQLPSTYSRMVAWLLDRAKDPLTKKRVSDDECYGALIGKLHVYLYELRDLQGRLIGDLDDLQKDVEIPDEPGSGSGPARAGGVPGDEAGVGERVAGCG
ncbi:hypothetical protein F4779DRAFT_619073 [Xylariaceae sp. FL0662B]|nr:hypothetical protein F4779DRAFT_619073 [Xylariaceae sp. FL0662B]